MPITGVIDYGAGNLRSVINAFEEAGVPLQIVNNKKEVENCDKLILPGVGAFPWMIQSLKEKKIFQPIEAHLALEKPFFGICLGMQALFEDSNEFGKTLGFGVLSGSVEPLPTGKLPVPNVGWWSLEGDFSSFANDLCADDSFYFVHSYYCVPKNLNYGLYIKYNEKKVLVGLRIGNILAVQFHPEKSQKSGQKLIRAFDKL